MTPEERLLELAEAWDWKVVAAIARVARAARTCDCSFDVTEALDALDGLPLPQFSGREEKK